MEMIEKEVEFTDSEGMTAGFQAISSAVTEDYIIFTLEKTWGSLVAKVSGLGEVTSGATFVPPIATEIKVYFTRVNNPSTEPPEDAIGYEELVMILRKQAELHKALVSAKEEKEF